jgi:hypothetical protein
MLLKYSFNDIRREKRLLDVEQCSVTVNERNYTLTVITKTPHRLRPNDIVLLKHNIVTVEYYSDAVDYLSKHSVDIIFVKKQETLIEKDVKKDDIEVTYPVGYYWVVNGKIEMIPQDMLTNVMNKYSSFNNNFTIICGSNDCEFQVVIPRYQQLNVSMVTDMDNLGIFTVKGLLPLLLHKGDTFTLWRRVYSYKYIRGIEAYDKFPEVTVNPYGQTEYLGYDTVIFAGNVYEWSVDNEACRCTYIDENTFSYYYDNTIIYENEILEIEDTRFITPDKTINSNVLFYEYTEHLTLDLPISHTSNIDLNHEYIQKKYFDERKQELITSINDYEKKCFAPYYNNAGKALTPVSKINFNLFLRDRSGSDEWNTNDAKGWNQHTMDDNGQFSTPSNITNGDLLNYLGFTDEDVYYRRKKIEKTFIRLSFYNSNNPFTQMLLFYSTIFLDTGELYTKYIHNLNNTTRNPDAPIVKQGIFGDNNLTLSFSVTDRYNRNKSSEGFYLYLFPDGLQEGEERTLYLKIEFNHAGNGKTIPLMYPCYGSTPLTFNSDLFPHSLLNEDGDLTELYKHMFIPVTIKYDSDRNEYIYYFNVAKYDTTNQEITIGLYEPKINPLT